MERIIAIIACIVFWGALAQGESGDEYTLEPPLDLMAAAVYLSPDNPLTAEKIALGKQLFFDPRLSGDQTLACASCHNPRFGFADGRFGL